MQLYFAVPDTATTHDGVLVRSFLRQCAVSTDLARAVKFRGGGFFADGVPVLANRRDGFRAAAGKGRRDRGRQA